MGCKRMGILLKVNLVVVSGLLLATLTAGQGYGASDDDGFAGGSGAFGGGSGGGGGGAGAGGGGGAGAGGGGGAGAGGGGRGGGGAGGGSGAGGGGGAGGGAGGGSGAGGGAGGGSGAHGSFPNNQQINALPQYDSAEQGQRQPGFGQQGPPYSGPAGAPGAGNPYGDPAGNPGNRQYGSPQQGRPGQAPWWQGQNAFQQPPGHPGVQQLAPSAQGPQHQQPGVTQAYNTVPGVTQPYNPGTTTYNPYGPYTTGAPPPYQQPGSYNPTTIPPPHPPTQQPGYNPPPQPHTTVQPFINSRPPPLPPQEPNVQPFPNPAPIGQQTTSPEQHNPPPTPPPQQPPQQGFGWNPQSQQPPQQNYFPQGQGQPPPVDEAPGCDLVNKADCHHNRRNFNVPPPAQNYQPPPQFQPQQPTYQQPAYQEPNVPVPNQNYRPPPPKTPRPQNPYQVPNYQQPQPQQQRPYTPPQAPRPVQQQQALDAPYPGCPAAMKCVQDEYCNSIGLIENAPIQFSAADRLHRVALMQCSEPMTGIVGYCCRDPTYTDPWPDMQKDGGPHHPHHPDKGQPQGHKPFQPPKSNHLQSGNPYSGTKTNAAEVTAANSNNDIKKSSKSLSHVVSPSSSPNFPSVSKQRLQVLESCSVDELCLSMSQCHSLNPEFMAKTGLNPAANKHNNNNVVHHRENDSELIKIKRCKYERSGIHYLCCKKPSQTTPSTSSEPTTSTFHFAPFRHSRPATTTTTTASSSIFTTPRPTTVPSTTTPLSSSFPGIFTLPFTSFTTARPTPQSSLITGVGLRFHSGLHSSKQQHLNSKKPNPYGEDEEPIQLNKPTTSTTPFSFLDGSTSTPTPSVHSFRFTTTTTPEPELATKSFPHNVFQQQQQNTARPISAFARVIGTTRTYFSTTLPPTNNDTFIPPSTSPTTTTTTTTEGKVDVLKVPIAVPLRPEIKENPPIGFVFKDDSLFIPEVEIPSQNFLVPINDFEERTFPTEPPPPQEEEGADPATVGLAPTENDGNGGGGGGEVHDNNSSSGNKRRVFNRKSPFLHNNSIEGTTIYSIVESSESNSNESSVSSGSQSQEKTAAAR